MARTFLTLLVLTLLASAALAQQVPSPPAWVKLCDSGTWTTKTKDGKEEKKDIYLCMTHHERIDAKTGAVTFSAALHDTKVDGKDSRHLRVMMPLEMRLPEGVRVSVFPKDVWARVAKNEKLKKADEAKVKALKLTYTHCHAVGCVAEVEATPEILASLKSGGGLKALTLNLSSDPITFDVPLAGFDQALAGPAVETKEFAKARTELMKQIEEHQRRMPLYERPTRCDLVVDKGGPCNPRLLLKGWRP